MALLNDAETLLADVEYLERMISECHKGARVLASKAAKLALQYDSGEFGIVREILVMLAPMDYSVNSSLGASFHFMKKILRAYVDSQLKKLEQAEKVTP